MLLYHYCDNKKLTNIIAGHTLRMSDITKSNDYEEMQLFYPYIMTAIEKEYKKDSFSFLYKEKKDFEALKELLHVVHTYINRMFEIGEMTNFVVCFCEEGDVLSQWRGYADAGKGGAIGFSVDELKKYCNSSGDIMKLAKVNYISKKELFLIIREKAQEVLLELQKELKWLDEKNLTDIDNEEYEFLIQMRMLRIISRVLVSSLEYKYDSFSEEKEWRIYFKDVITKNPEWLFENQDEQVMQYDRIISKLKDKIEFNVTDDDLIPYYPIDLFDLSAAPIKEVILGPKNIILKKDFELYTRKYKMKNIVLKFSRISFRG